MTKRPAQDHRHDRVFWRVAVWLCLWFAVGCAHIKPQPNHVGRAFDFKQDTFAFVNQTVWAYQDGQRVQTPESRSENRDRYTHRCFVMARATIQFWRFARFEPDAPAASNVELERKVRQVVARRPTGPSLPLQDRVVFPGYANLRNLSERQAAVLRANLGSSLATYFRPGNFFLPYRPSKEHQARTSEELQAWLEMGQPMALWIYDFKFPKPTLNHAVVAYAKSVEGGKTVYQCYDPNDATTPKRFEFDPQTGIFSFDKQSYFLGGKASVRPCYVNFFE
ncbi:MAG: hypothetical protein NT105_03395 [Verrucomicrobia bacterium]|nr:hypothetical protein [Verrucomicrobiota bacterium]